MHARTLLTWHHFYQIYVIHHGLKIQLNVYMVQQRRYERKISTYNLTSTASIQLTIV